MFLSIQNMETILKLFWKSKKVENEELELLNEYDTETIDELCKEAFEKKTKTDKIEIITMTKEDDRATYYQYFFDSKHDYERKEVAINITVKQPAKKQLTFEEKLGLFSQYVKDNNKVPEKGTLINDCDIGAFYQQISSSGEKVKQVDKVVEKYT